MRSMDAKWKQLAADGEFTLKSRAVINGVTYDTITAPVITRGLLPDKKLSVGNCIAGTLKFTVLTRDEIPRSAQVVIESCLSDGTDDSEWHEMGTFWVDKRSINSELVDYDLIDLECYDAMLKGNQAYSDNDDGLNWPKPMSTVVARIAEQMGVAIDSRTTIKTGGDYVVTMPTEEMTLLDILGYIGALHGGNWTITPENKLRLVPIVFPYEDGEYYIIDEYGNYILCDDYLLVWKHANNGYNVIDENDNLIVGNGDSLVWRHADETNTTNNAGGGLLNVPVVTGEIKTFGAEPDSIISNNEDRTLGEYRLISGSYQGDEAETYFSGIVGNGIDATQTTSNYYSPSGTTAVFRYSMAFDLPGNAVITNIYCDVNGHAESLTAESEYMCVQLVSGNTTLSEMINFKDVSRSNTTVRLECTTTPTVEQLASMELECTLGHYGGAINGATVYVEYTVNHNAISGVTISVDSETKYMAGNTGGIVLEIENNPYGTQNLCELLLAEYDGVAYIPFEITRACYDPAAELGDWIIVGDKVTSVMYTETQTLDIGFIANAAAPGEEELESEYPVTTALKRVQYSVEGLTQENKVVKSEIRQMQDQILLRVTAGDVESIIEQNADSIRLKAGRISWESDYTSMTPSGVLTIQGAAITGTMSSVRQESGVSSGMLISKGRIMGLYQNNNVFNILMPYESDDPITEYIDEDGNVTSVNIEPMVPEMPEFDLHDHMYPASAGTSTKIAAGSGYGVEIGAGGETAIVINTNGEMWLCPSGGLYVDNYATYYGTITINGVEHPIVNGLICIY